MAVGLDVQLTGALFESHFAGRGAGFLPFLLLRLRRSGTVPDEPREPLCVTDGDGVWNDSARAARYGHELYVVRVIEVVPGFCEEMLPSEWPHAAACVSSPASANRRANAGCTEDPRLRFIADESAALLHLAGFQGR